MMRRKWAFLFAFLGIISAVFLVKKTMAPPPKAPILIEPPAKPFPTTLAAAGIVEALNQNLAVGSPVSGIVQDVFCQVGQKVQQGDALFKIDSRELDADLKVHEAREQVAKAEYDLIHAQLMRLRSIQDARAISQEELHSKENSEKLAFAKVKQAQAEKAKTEALLDRLLVKAPRAGVILQKNIHAGEFLLQNIETAPLILGDLTQLQIRADIDEQNAAHIVTGAKGFATPKNRPDCKIPLSFVRVEPYVIPKKSLTGSSREKIDTRVLQVIFTMDPPKDFPLYIGQQVDVFIERAAP